MLGFFRIGFTSMLCFVVSVEPREFWGLPRIYGVAEYSLEIQKENFG
jgi:hypothetical protein